MSEKLNYYYEALEEKLNVISHAIGFILSAVAFPSLVYKALDYDGFLKPISFLIYGASLLLLYAASTLYHAAKNPKKRRKLNILDHAAIYVLIAGSFTPFCLVTLGNKPIGFYLFIFIWIFALIGVILKLFFTGKFQKLSTAMYLLMGWQVVFFIKPLIENLSTFNLNLLFAGGFFYSIGAVLYAIKKIPYNHAIFHVFVLLGSICHFIAIFNL
ncbi:PAQR family membrane homeostasis protein TrhA [Polaribacter tangerinus]|uniref:PAQR family membrane homeostasis protein TrhA n=1 Tax=Polaribacter tangerinus TaxID=1920034 RepID=UPI000B4A923C|nr:hemolysin III family protein [Polaribacter tangerinus]